MYIWQCSRECIRLASQMDYSWQLFSLMHKALQPVVEKIPKQKYK